MYLASSNRAHYGQYRFLLRGRDNSQGSELLLTYTLYL